jgi:hypothetical protein
MTVENSYRESMENKHRGVTMKNKEIQRNGGKQK